MDTNDGGCAYAAEGAPSSSHSSSGSSAPSPQVAGSVVEGAVVDGSPEVSWPPEVSLVVPVVVSEGVDVPGIVLVEVVDVVLVTSSGPVESVEEPLELSAADVPSMTGSKEQARRRQAGESLNMVGPEVADCLRFALERQGQPAGVRRGG